MDEKGNFSRGWGWMDMVIFLGDGVDRQGNLFQEDGVGWTG